MRRLAKWVAGIGVALAFAPAAAQAEELDWQPCDPGFQCATASVPRDYAHPRGPEVQIALIRRPASDSEHRIGSLFVNPGGPGGSGIDFVRTAPPGALAAFGRLYDFVGFDPRGVGRSTPAINGCGILYTHRFEMTDSLDLPSLLRRTRDQLRACEAGSGGILPYLTTANVARDLDRLRAAVGDERLNYIGLSWGTQLGATYTSLFPRRVGAFILDAPADPDVWINRPYEATREQVASFESSFARFLHWCTRNASVCTLDPDDPEDDVDALIAAMNAAPLQGEIDRRRPDLRGRERAVLEVRVGAAGPRDLGGQGGRRQRDPRVPRRRSQPGQRRVLRLHGEREPLRERRAPLPRRDAPPGGDRAALRDHPPHAVHRHGDVAVARARRVSRAVPERGRRADAARHRRHARPGDALRVGAALRPPARQRAAADLPQRRARRAHRPQPVRRASGRSATWRPAHCRRRGRRARSPCRRPGCAGRCRTTTCWRGSGRRARSPAGSHAAGHR